MSWIAVLTSGGVDSSVALCRLVEQGKHRLEAYYLKIWLEDRRPDVVGLQELKLTDDRFPLAERTRNRMPLATSSAVTWLGNSAFRINSCIQVRSWGIMYFSLRDARR